MLPGELQPFYAVPRSLFTINMYIDGYGGALSLRLRSDTSFLVHKRKFPWLGNHQTVEQPLKK